MNNDDLAAELKACGHDSIVNLQILHNGKKAYLKGNDFCIATDPEGCLPGTAWMIWHMCACFAKCATSSSLMAV